MNYKSLYIWVFCVLAFAKAYSQQATNQDSYSFTLEEAVTYGLENNYQAINAKRDIAKALKQKWETTATGLPQIDGSANYNYQIKQPITPLPAELVGGAPGTFVPVTFSPKQSATLTATLRQLIFDGSYIVALEASKTFLDFSENANNKTKLEVRKGIINAYGGVLLTQENISIIERNLETLTKNLNETTKIYENGLAEEEDVEQLKITKSQLENQLNSARRQEDIATDMLKLALGIDLQKSVSLKENLASLALKNMDPSMTTNTLELEKNADYNIASNFTEQRRLEYKLERAKALPTLSGFVNYGVNSFNDDFTFLDGDNKWFGQSVAGISLSVPIFSSLGRQARTDRAKIAWDQSITDLDRTKEEIRLNYQTALNNYQIAIDNYSTSRDNLQLAERIENKNQIKFREGLATSFDLRQAQTQLYSTQSTYLQSMYDVINEKANLETILNTPEFTTQK
ncbi:MULTISPECIES: TolC family protein [Nonlabens]|uniref:Outer membrane protein TolC n=1 Tax=Nonlabens xylanidelens TaxID=191564 RepID=A0A2S6IQ44_9FLAO|nr:TolC family protein [Nonlabens xylanidelens]PPK96367.1 outer membrane protein TolC [Nonlabens xylanidelens]PQJ18093.1 transporter [Nonlabens xylanidelens]